MEENEVDQASAVAGVTVGEATLTGVGINEVLPTFLGPSFLTSQDHLSLSLSLLQKTHCSRYHSLLCFWNMSGMSDANKGIFPSCFLSGAWSMTEPRLPQLLSEHRSVPFIRGWWTSNKRGELLIRT